MPSDSSSKAVLIADDSTMTQRLLNGLVSDLGFGPIHLASDGRAALDLWVEHRPPLVLLDILMPNLSGIEVLEKIRQDDSQTKVVMISGLQSRDEVMRCRELNANGYILKPFESERVRVVLSKVAGDLLGDSDDADEAAPKAEEDAEEPSKPTEAPSAAAPAENSVDAE